MDLSKAFDSIDHEILLRKLLDIGFDNSARNLLGNYLSNRTQSVKINGLLSNWLNIKYGVPQGTVLGPLLYTLYVNDIATSLNCNYVQYADDTLLFTSARSLDEAIEELSVNCNQLLHYFHMHKLNLSVSKTDFITYSPTKKQDTESTLTIDGSDISSSTEIKYLGVVIDNRFTFDCQIRKVLTKISMGILTIRYINTKIPLKARIQLLRALVISQLQYACVLYNGISQENKNKLERELNWGMQLC